MFGKCAVILTVCTYGVLGSVFHGKRSDFSMYDNQFCKSVSVCFFVQFSTSFQFEQMRNQGLT